MGVVDDATAILHLLAGFEQTPGDTKRGRYALEGKDIAEKVQLDAERINDAVNVLEENGHVEVERYLGTAPYDFGYVELTARGRVEAEHLAMQQAGADAPTLGATVAPMATSITPVGSPFGFTDEDWEAVALDRNAKDALIVVFGYQWKSDSYDTDKLRESVREMFEASLVRVLSKGRIGGVALQFRPLQAGYGTHVFNTIARDIIGADVAVFDTSDLNPNVMIEVGVALTWGTRVLPIRDEPTGPPPSDISGQTWTVYRRSGVEWPDPQHNDKLDELVRRALRKKGVAFPHP